MRYGLEVPDKLSRIFRKMKKRDVIRANILKRKIKEILDNPYIGKPLRSRLAGKRRIHVRPFVLTYEILESERIVRLLDYDHHDNIYR